MKDELVLPTGLGSDIECANLVAKIVITQNHVLSNYTGNGSHIVSIFTESSYTSNYGYCKLSRDVNNIRNNEIFESSNIFNIE